MDLLTDQLTDKELTILVMLAKGYTGKEIGETFGKSESTGQHWVVEVCAKLNAKTPAQAVAIALSAGIIE